MNLPLDCGMHWLTLPFLGIKRFWLILAAAYLATVPFLYPHIYYAGDDLMYQLMTYSAGEHGSLYLTYGWQDLPSPLFKYFWAAWSNMFIETPGGERLTTLYPPLYGLFGAPFFALFRTDGLFFLNALCFLVTIPLTYRVAWHCFRSESLAKLSATLFVFTTFAWHYSVTALSHSQAAALILFAAYGMCRILESAPDGKRTAALGWATAAGFSLGLAVATRLDSLFAFPVVIAPLFFARPMRWRPFFAFLPGLAVPLALLSAFNHARYGDASPFSYGPQILSVFGYETFIFPALFLGTICGAWWLWLRLPERLQGPTLRIASITAPVAFVGVLMVLTETAFRNASSVIWGRDLLPDTIGLYEKALLQSMPIAVLAPVAAYLICKDRKTSLPLVMAVLFPLTYCTVFAVAGYIASFHYYQRYLIPALPFICMLTAYAWQHFVTFDRKTVWAVFGVSAALCFAGLYWIDLEQDHFAHKDFVLIVPAFLSVLLLMFCVASQILRRGKQYAQARANVGTLIVAIAGWTFGQIFLSDIRTILPLHAPFKAFERAAEGLPENAFLLVHSEYIRFTPVFLDAPDLRMALYPPLGYPVPPDEEVLRVTNFYAEKGRPVFTYAPSESRIPEILTHGGYITDTTDPMNPELQRWSKR
jgi:Dolichyl-phosphate-mannose-protein mannosyltransferase